MLLKLDENGKVIQQIGYDPTKTVKVTISANDSYTLDCTDDIYVNIVQTTGTITTEMNGDGNVTDIKDYVIGNKFTSLKINDTSGADNTVLIYRT